MSETLIICGGGRTVWSDLGRIPDWNQHHSMAVNDAIMYFPGRLDHAYSNDCIINGINDRMLLRWYAARRPENRQQDTGTKLHSCFGHGVEGVRHWDIKGHGTSGLNAVYVGLGLGYQRIILCGIPLDNEGHFFDPPWKRTNFNREVPTKRAGPNQLRFWSAAKERDFNGKVFSMSGRTKELLGEPVFSKSRVI